MAVLLTILGALGVIAGVVMIAYGIPVKEFSLGNTLILAGTTAASGGLIVIALGLAIGRLSRIADALLARSMPAGLGTELPDILSTSARASAPGAAGRPPFPSRPRAEPAARDLEAPAATSAEPESHEQPVFPRMTRDEPAVPAELEQAPPVPPVVPRQPSIFPPPPFVSPSADVQPRADAVEPPPVRAEPRHELPRDTSWRAAERRDLDAVWSKAPHPETHAAPEVRPEPAPEPRVDMPPASPATPEPAAEEVPAPADQRSVAILKSGVVDGMGYTLYVDGSIEAELPQGTVRFASIAELRAHLENNS